MATTTAKTSFRSLAPVLNVSNVQRSIDFYVGVLGFEIAFTWGEPTDFAGVKRDDIELFLCENGQGDGVVWLSVFVDDVDVLHSEYQSTGAEIVQPPTNFPWGVREMNVRDPDGHRIRFGSETTGPADGVNLADNV